MFGLQLTTRTQKELLYNNTTFCNVIMAKCALVPFDTCYIIPYGAWIKHKNLTYETVFINDQLGKLLTQH